MVGERRGWVRGFMDRNDFFIDLGALFSWQNFGFWATVALSFLFDKHCPITE